MHMLWQATLRWSCTVTCRGAAELDGRVLSVARRKLRLEASLRALEAAADAARRQSKSGATRAANADTTNRIEAMHRLLAETQVSCNRMLTVLSGKIVSTESILVSS